MDLVTGTIYPNEALDEETLAKARATIERLGLDEQDAKDIRVKHYGWLMKGGDFVGLVAEYSPFVWYEASRQGLL